MTDKRLLSIPRALLTTEEGVYIHGSLGALLVSDIQEELFVQGKSFSFEDYFTMDAAEVINIVVDPTAFAGENLTFNPLILAATAGPITVDFYAGVSADDDGTVLEASNRRFGGGSPSVVLRQNPTITVVGTRFAGDLVPSTGTNPNVGNGSGNIRGIPFELNPAIKYSIKITNTNGAGVMLLVKLTWFEV